VPIYEFLCKECDLLIELIQKYNEKTPSCEGCGEDLRKMISKNSFRLKGRGWYKDGYSKGE